MMDAFYLAAFLRESNFSFTHTNFSPSLPPSLPPLFLLLVVVRRVQGPLRSGASGLQDPEAHAQGVGQGKEGGRGGRE